MNITRVIGFFLFIITLTHCSSLSTNETKTNKVELIDKWILLDESDYSIQYPDTFEINKTGQMGTSFVLLSRLTSSQDQFRENINLLTQDLSNLNIDLDKYVEISESQIKEMFQNSSIIESKRIKNGNKEFQKIIYTGRQGRSDLKWLQYFWVENKKAYVLTLTCEENQFDNYAEVGESIFNTFHLK